VEPEYHDPQDHWYGTFLTLEVIAFNSRLLSREEAPQDWDDLLAPRWKGKILLRDPMPSGTMRTIFCAMIWRFYREDGEPTRGFDWLRRLDAHTKAYTADPQEMLRRLAAGEGLVTVWNLTDILQQQHLYQMPLDYVIPRSGTPVVTEGIALVRGAPHPRAARAFYEFVTSPEALRAQAEPPFFRYPARKDLPLETLPEWVRRLEFQPLPLDWHVFAEKQDEWMKYWDENIRGRG
jgi:iron(III) transport system substrate-binding protein